MGTQAKKIQEKVAAKMKGMGGATMPISKADREFMGKNPTRMEVANFVDGVLQDRFLPLVMGTIQMGLEVVRKVLITKGVVTAEEWTVYEHEVMEDYKKRLAETKSKEHTDDHSGESSGDTTQQDNTHTEQ